MSEVPGPQYGIRTRVAIPFAEAVEEAVAALKVEGFGVLTRIDLQQAMKEKLGKDFPPYVILGACNPGLAYRALQEETELGILLPCNVIVYQTEAGVVVSAMDPTVALEAVRNDKLAGVALEARERLHRAIRALEERFGKA